MALGIKPTVDFAFKKIFGSPQNSVALIGLLNAILDLDSPIESVQILNPFSYQEFAESKLIVLDVKCRDEDGRWLNVEMQVAVYAGLVERLVYYACSMYVDQLSKGGDYASAVPAISICLLNHLLYADTAHPHHRFQLQDRASHRTLENAIEIHTVELTKYNLVERTISVRSKLEQWAFLMLRAQDYDARTLKRLLPGIEFETAIDTIEVISAKTEDKQMYDQREKAQRDYEWAMSSARKEGHEKGREEGREVGREEGLECGLQLGEERGRKSVLAESIRMLEELLGDKQSDEAGLLERSPEMLKARVAELKQRLRDRQI